MEHLVNPNNAKVIFTISENYNEEGNIKQFTDVFESLIDYEDEFVTLNINTADIPFKCDSKYISEYCGYLLDLYLENEFGTNLFKLYSASNGSSINNTTNDENIIFSDILSLPNSYSYFTTDDFGSYLMTLKITDGWHKDENIILYVRLHLLSKHSTEDMAKYSSYMLDA